MCDALQHIKDLTRWGYGIAWHPVYRQYRPFSIDGESIEWWHDPGSIGNDNFEQAIESLYGEIQPQEFKKHLEQASKIVATWPEWKRIMLGGHP